MCHRGKAYRKAWLEGGIILKWLLLQYSLKYSSSKAHLGFLCLMCTPLTLTRSCYITQIVVWLIYTHYCWKYYFKKNPFKRRGKCLRQGFGKKYRWSFSGLEAVSGPALLKRKGLWMALVKYADGLSIHITNSPWQWPPIDHSLTVSAVPGNGWVMATEFPFTLAASPGPPKELHWQQKRKVSPVFCHAAKHWSNKALLHPGPSRQHFSWVLPE